MGSQGRRGKRPMWNSRKAWALVLGGMLAIGIANVAVGMCSLPEGFDENWRWADAGVLTNAGVPTDAGVPNDAGSHAPVTDLDAAQSK